MKSDTDIIKRFFELRREYAKKFGESIGLEITGDGDIKTMVKKMEKAIEEGKPIKGDYIKGASY